MAEIESGDELPGRKKYDDIGKELEVFTVAHGLVNTDLSVILKDLDVPISAGTVVDLHLSLTSIMVDLIKTMADAQRGVPVDTKKLGDDQLSYTADIFSVLLEGLKIKHGEAEESARGQ